MPKLDLNKIKDRVRKSLEKSKRNGDIVGLGTDMAPIPDYIPAPLPIQRLMGLDGYPIRRVTMISGKPDSGKTTLGMLAMIEAQKKDYYAILVDTEKKFDMDRFDKMEGDPEGILKVTASTIEDGFTGLESLLDTIIAEDKDANIFIVWDSIGGTPSKFEMEARADESIQLATAAKSIKRNLRVFVQRFDTQNIGLVMINQMYKNISSVGNSNAGGQGVDYYSSIILQLSRTGHYVVTRDGEKFKAGVDTEGTITKNHVAKGDRTLYKAKFRVKAYEIEEIDKKGRAKRKDEGDAELAFEVPKE